MHMDYLHISKIRSDKKKKHKNQKLENVQIYTLTPSD